MDTKFEEIFTSPENEIFSIVFYPDRIYHAQYLNATRSPRYRYYVHEVRNKFDITALKGQVYLDGMRLCNFLRFEYRAGRLVEQVREKERFLRDIVNAHVTLLPENSSANTEAEIKLTYCPWIDAYQAEIWETLETPYTKSHDYRVLDLMGRHGSITSIASFRPALKNINDLKKIKIFFKENNQELPDGFNINNQQEDTDYNRSYQAPNSSEASSPYNTVFAKNYLLDFRRGWFLDTNDVAPVRYLNGLIEPENPDHAPNNIIAMRWILQQELGSSLVYFHEVLIPPGCVEGTHRHIGSEELYYIVEGEGIAYMGEGDDPTNAQYPLKNVDIFGIGKRDVRELPIKPGYIIYTKSGGIHGIRNPGTTPLKFVAFGYHGS
jgi:mannose-6-phosphate isomerase-like protein (cupin superfamily)